MRRNDMSPMVARDPGNHWRAAYTPDPRALLFSDPAYNKPDMITTKHFALIAVLSLVVLHSQTMPARADVVPVDSRNATGVTALSWNKANHEAPFLPLPGELHSGLAAQLVYPSGDFAFPLLQPLYHDSRCDCYTMTVSMRASGALRIVQLWRAPLGFYRTANGPYLELEDSDSLKVLTALNGTRFLFTEVGDGEWRCVSIHDPLGSYLLIDYRADGLISRLRDSLSRTAVPTYNEGRMVSLTQTWTTRSGQRALTTLITDLSRY